jgi:hypothetical protein
MPIVFDMFVFLLIRNCNYIEKRRGTQPFDMFVQIGFMFGVYCSILTICFCLCIVLLVFF